MPSIPQREARKEAHVKDKSKPYREQLSHLPLSDAVPVQLDDEGQEKRRVATKRRRKRHRRLVLRRSEALETMSRLDYGFPSTICGPGTILVGSVSPLRGTL
jgi:hypothetical protein